MRTGEAELKKILPADCRPFLKWPGGKRRLLPELITRLPDKFEIYHEPFLGGGALFFALQPGKAVLSDINSELINAYEVVQNEVDELIESLQQHCYDKEHFYSIRELDRSPDFELLDPVEKAARTIYLNRTCYNGLFRVNSKGQFNTPFGRYSNPTICDAGNLRSCAGALEQVTFKVSSFEEILDRVAPADFVYFDPPYVPISSTANFVGYARDGFSIEDQETLLKVAKELDRRGVFFMLSNSYNEIVCDLYSSFNIDVVEAPRAISCKGKKRDRVREVIVRNYN